MSRNEEVLARARDWIGTPYRHQASCKGAGTDCLGLLRGIWREIYGAEPRNVPAYTPDWSEPTGEEVLLKAATDLLRSVAPGAGIAGDVLVFRMRAGAVAKHMALLAETGPSASFIHAYSGHGVVETALSDPWRRKICARFHFPEGA